MDMAVQPQGGVHRQVGVVAVHVHPQVQADVAHQGADGTQADDTQGLTVELRAHKGGFAFLHGGGYIHIWSVSLFLDPVHAPDDVPGGDEHGGNDQLLHRVCVGAGRVENHDALFRARLHRDVVDARAGAGYGLQLVAEGHLVKGSGSHHNCVGVLEAVPHRVFITRKTGCSHSGNFIHQLYLKHVHDHSFPVC